MTYVHNGKTFTCPVDLTLSMIAGKWKILIIWHLKSGELRYGQLKKTLDGINHKMLTQQLRELEVDGIIHRKVYEVVPPKVEYSLTDRGQSLLPVLEAMQLFGKQFILSLDN